MQNEEKPEITLLDYRQVFIRFQDAAQLLPKFKMLHSFCLSMEQCRQLNQIYIVTHVTQF